MSKRLVIIALLLLSLALAACQGQQSQPTATQASPTAEAYASETAEVDTEPTQTAQAGTPEGQSAPAGCTVQSLQPTAGPTEQSLFPPVTEKDWTQGPVTASVTIIEYSDYQ